jgi:hypothetical protein
MNLEGGCACRTIRYRLTESPLIVHACHCRDCQRLTGGPFVINVWIEGKFVEPGPVAPKSGDCLFVRAGTLDTPEAVRPDVHIHTRSKLPWLSLPEGVPAFQTGYKIDDVWSAESKERLRRNRTGQA